MIMTPGQRGFSRMFEAIAFLVVVTFLMCTEWRKPMNIALSTSRMKSFVRGSSSEGKDNGYPTNDKSKVAYVTYGHFTNGSEWRFPQLILASVQTWLTDDVYYFVINRQWKEKYEAACSEPENMEPCKRVVPIYVDCPEGFKQPAPCCKVDQGMSAVWKNYSHYDWYVYQDDDMYIRTSFLEDFVNGLDKNEPMVLAKHPKRLGVPWEEYCSAVDGFMYPWGQPVVYSRGAMQVMEPGFQMGAMEKQCVEFRVMHDVGNAIVHWMYALPAVRLPPINVRPPEVFTSDLLGTHGVSHKAEKEGDKEVYPSMMEIHEQVLKHSSWPPPPYDYQWHRPLGFYESDTYEMYGNISDWDVWHTMPTSDCIIRRDRHKNGTRSM